MWTTRCVVPLGAGLALCLCLILSIEATASDPSPRSPLTDVNEDGNIDGQDINALIGDVGDPPGPPIYPPLSLGWPGVVAQINPSGEISVSAANVHSWTLRTKDVDGDGNREQLFDPNMLPLVQDVLVTPPPTTEPDMIGEGNFSVQTPFSFVDLNLGSILVDDALPITADNMNDYFELAFTYQWFSATEYPGTLVFVPEPSTLAMLAFGGIGIVLFRWRRKP